MNWHINHRLCPTKCYCLSSKRLASACMRFHAAWTWCNSTWVPPTAKRSVYTPDSSCSRRHALCNHYVSGLPAIMLLRVSKPFVPLLSSKNAFPQFSYSGHLICPMLSLWPETFVFRISLKKPSITSSIASFLNHETYLEFTVWVTRMSPFLFRASTSFEFKVRLLSLLPAGVLRRKQTNENFVGTIICTSRDNLSNQRILLSWFP